MLGWEVELISGFGGAGCSTAGIPCPSQGRHDFIQNTTPHHERRLFEGLRSITIDRSTA